MMSLKRNERKRKRKKKRRRRKEEEEEEEEGLVDVFALWQFSCIKQPE